ncbi:hypothetical protein BH11ACT7_BH11ACT7_15270 [soil metagenome]
MSSALSGFDDWLNRMLERCAHDAGESVNAYVTRAVATQMVADQRRAESNSIEELMEHLAECGALAATEMPDVKAEINNPQRLRALYATGLLDTAPEELYDRITRAAAAALDTPAASLTLVDADRQFFKSTVGMKIESPQDRQTPLPRSVCQYAVASAAPLVLDDARVDPVFKNHPAVVDGMVVAYLGIPLIDGDGNAIGTLCVFDSRPRMWGTGHVQVLSDLAKLAVERIFSSVPDSRS